MKAINKWMPSCAAWGLDRIKNFTILYIMRFITRIRSSDRMEKGNPDMKLVPLWMSVAASAARCVSSSSAGWSTSPF